MTHEDRGHYAGKHTGITLDRDICEHLEASRKDSTISCAAVHRIAGILDRPPLEVGTQADLMELRLVRCQLGLFGHHPHGKVLEEQFTIQPALDARLEETAVDGRLSCAECWEIAGALKIKRTDVASACEKKGIKIKFCQLGAF